jgi:hypothetical protein
MEDLEKKYNKIMERLLKDLKIFDTKSERVENIHSKESTALTPLELAVYDYFKGIEALELWRVSQEYLDEFDACKWWFLKNNPTIYRKLID